MWSCASQRAARTSRIHCSNRHDNWELPVRQRRRLLWWGFFFFFLHFNKKNLTRFALQLCKCYTWSPWCCFLELVKIPQSILRIICMGEIKRIFLMRFKRYADISGGGLKWEAKTITIHPRVVLLADVGTNPPGPLQLMMRETSALDTGGLCPTNDLGCVSTSLFLCYRSRFSFWTTAGFRFFLGFFWWTLRCLLSRRSQIYKPIFIIRSVPQPNFLKHFFS